jgi:hemolysin III
MKKTSLGELIANSISHGVGALLSIAGIIILIIKAETSKELFAVLVFGLSLFMLYISSTLFHAFPEKMKRVFAVFQRLDHSAIYLLIAGTYTPFIVLSISTNKAYILLAALWFIAILGIVAKSIWIKKFKYLHLVNYLLMGWSIVFVYRDLVGILSNVIVFVLIGGIFYTVGIGFYISRFKYQHFIWHLFVLLGSIFHYVAVYLILSL